MRADDYARRNIEYHQELSPKAWSGARMLPEVRYKLLRIANKFVDFLEIPDFKIEDIVLTGSMANFNYTEFSDFDVHVVTDYTDLKCDDLAEAFYAAKKRIWNDEHDITIRGHEAELYVEDIKQPPVSGGVYSILNNKWLKEPSYDPPRINDNAVNQKVQNIMIQIDKAIEYGDVGDLKHIFDKIKRMRKSGLAKTGEFGVENLTFKVLRNEGYIEKVTTARRELEDEAMSLRETEIDEIAMNPAAFQQSLQNAENRGALVGFEFEVYMPYQGVPQLDDEKIGQLLIDQLTRNPFYDITDFPVEQFDKIFKPTDRTEITSVTEIFNAQVDSIEQEIMQLKSLFKPQTWSAAVRQAKRFVDNYGSPSKAQRRKTYVRVLARKLIESSTKKIEELLDILAFIDKHLQRWPDILEYLLDPPSITSRNFSEYFTVDTSLINKNIKNDLLSRYMSEKDIDDNTAQFINMQAAVAETMSAAVHIKPGGKFKNKNLTDWYVEYDGSLDYELNEGDVGMEIVSPPLPISQAMSALDKFYALAAEKKLYTNHSTGLHINVSIPDEIDLLKLMLITGEQHVLQQFSRENNEYVNSVIRSIQSPDQVRINQKSFAAGWKYLERIAKQISNDHYASISKEGKRVYISFRHAGGDYLQDKEKIKNTVGRFVRAIDIASDPNAYRDEYLKKLYAMTQKVAPAISRPGPSSELAAIQKIQQNGLPVKEITIFTLKDHYSGADEAIRQLKRSLESIYPKKMFDIVGINDANILKSAAATVNQHRNNMFKPKAYFGKTFMIIPLAKPNMSIDDIMAALNKVQEPPFQPVDTQHGLDVEINKTLPAKDPTSLAFIKQLYLKYKAVKAQLAKSKAVLAKTPEFQS